MVVRGLLGVGSWVVGLGEGHFEGSVLVEDLVHEGDGPLEGTVGHDLPDEYHGFTQLLG